MTEETLSQSAIDALLAGKTPPPKQAPASQTRAASPASEPAAPQYSPPEGPSPISGAQSRSGDDAIDAIESTVGDLMDRVAKLEAGLRKVDALEKTVRALGEQQGGPDSDANEKLKALENSILTLSQLQHENIGASQQVSELKTAVQNLSQHLQQLMTQVQATAQEVKVIKKGLEGTVGYAIKDTFECQYCGSQGYVVGLVKCTDCGEEDWWGWYPPESDDGYYDEDNWESSEYDDWDEWE